LLGVNEDEIIYYGKYKTKLSLNLINPEKINKANSSLNSPRRNVGGDLGGFQFVFM